MSITRPTSEQVTFHSDNTGDHILDNYLEDAQPGGRELGEALGDIFQTTGVNAGKIRTDLFEVRENPSTPGELQMRFGYVIDNTAAWVTINDSTNFSTKAAEALASANAAAASATTAEGWATDPNVTTVANNISDINTTATDIVNINTAAGNIANINTVATDPNIAVVVDNVSDITTVASDITSVVTCANNMADIQNASTIAGDLTTTINTKVTGPASATDSALVQFDGTTGKLVKGGPTIGSGANQIVQRDASGRLTGDGSQLTNLPASGGTFTATASADITDGDPLALDMNGGLKPVSQVSASSGAATQIQGHTAAYHMRSCAMSNNKIALIYQQSSSSDVWVQIGTVSGTSTSWGTPVQVSSATSYKVDIVELEEDKLFAIWMDGSSSLAVQGAVITVSGTVPTVQTSDTASINTNTVAYAHKLMRVSSTKVAFLHKQNSPAYTYIETATISGNTTTWSTNWRVSTETVWTRLSADLLSDTHMLISYINTSSNVVGVLVADFNSETAGSAITVSSAFTGYRTPSVAKIDGNTGLILWTSTGTGAGAFVSHISVSGTTATHNGDAKLNTTTSSYGDDYYTDIVYMGQDTALAMWFDSSGHAQYAIIDINGTSLEGRGEVEIDGTTVLYHGSIAYFGENLAHFMWSTAGSSYLPYSRGYVVADYTNANNLAGIADGTVTSGNTATALITGAVSSAQSGLTAGSSYYVADDGSLTTAATSGRYIGRALSATELLVDRSYYVTSPDTSTRTLLATLAPSGATQIDYLSIFTDYPGYDRYEVELDNVNFASHSALQMRVSTNGSTVLTTQYRYNGIGMGSDATTVLTNNSANTSIVTLHSNNVDSTNNGIQGKITFSNPETSLFFKIISYEVNFVDSSSIVRSFRGAVTNYQVSDALTGFRLQSSSGNFDQGVIRIYGVN